MMRWSALWLGVLAVAVCPLAGAMERVTLKNGQAVDCARHEVVGGHVRLYLADAPDGSNYFEVAAGDVMSVEMVADPPRAVTAKPVAPQQAAASTTPTKAEMREMLARAGAVHDIDEDLLASVVRAESGGQVRAVSRTGARGLMQLMPGTANEMGVTDSFRPDENIAGGTAYLDELLRRYHDNVALALAAYNAGPAAVDRYHGIPPYHETRAYVARVIREFNRRKRMAMMARGQ